MYVRPEEFAKLVRNRQQAESIITELVTRFAGESAQEAVKTEAFWSKQSPKEIVRRGASNLLTSYRLHRRTY